jgi:hypothetical protein
MRKFKIGSTLFLRTLILAMAGVVFLAIGAQAQVNNTPPNGGPNGRDNRAFIGTISNNPVHLSSTSGYSGLGYSGYVELSELNIGSSSSLSIDTGGTLTSTNIKNYGIINLNGGTLQGDPYAVQGTYLWDVVGAGKFNVTADSTLSGKFTWGVSNQLVRFNIGNVGGGTGDLGPQSLRCLPACRGHRRDFE